MGTKERAAKWLATGFGSGLFPRCPGTTGSAAALVVWGLAHYCFPNTGYLIDALCFVAAMTAGFWSVRIYLTGLRARRSSRPDDPGEVVIDEWAGMFLALFGSGTLNPAGALIAFALFRFFDIIKPYPVCRLERLPGALGIMADDVMAGVYARIFLYAGLMFYDSLSN